MLEFHKFCLSCHKGLCIFLVWILITSINSVKIFTRGKDVSVENLHQGFTHVFETTFESVEGISEYLAHPAHVEFADKFLPTLEKVLIIDYKPTTA